MRTKTALVLSLLASSFLANQAQSQPQAQGEKDGRLIKQHAPTDHDSSVDLSEFKGGGISVKYPRGWEVDPSVQSPRVLHVKTLGGKVNASVTVQDVPDGTTLEEYKDATISDIAVDAKALNPTKLSEESTHLGDMQAWKFIYSISVPNAQPNVSAKQTLFISVKGNRGYLLCCTAFDELPSKFDSVFRAMADSVKAIETDPAK